MNDTNQFNELVIDSFVLKKGKSITSLVGLEQNWKDYFIPIEEINANSRGLVSIKLGSIEGSIVIKTYGKTVLGIEYWDFVDQLWFYFVTILSEIILEEKKYAKFYFPDQPVLVELERKRDIALLSIDGIKNSFPYHHFTSRMLESAEKFFIHASTVSMQPEYYSCIELIRKLKSS